MKQKILTFILMMSALWISHRGFAYDFEVDGICYTVTSFEDFVVTVDGLNSSLSGIVELPSSVTYNNKTFRVTSILSAKGADIESVIIPVSITTIYGGAFSSTSIKYLDIPDNVVSVGRNCFKECKNLESIRISRNVSVLQTRLFKDCTNLKEVEWHPLNSSKIEDESFENCSSLKSFTIPSTCSEVGNGDNRYYIIAFQNCSSLDTLIIEDGTGELMFVSENRKDNPNSTTYVHYGEFQGCPIKYLYLGRSYNVKTNEKVWECWPRFSPNDLIIGDGVQTLATCPDYKKSIVIGKSYKGKLYSDKELEYIKIRQSTPPQATGFSNYIYINTILYVPKGAKSIYESTDIWKNFWNIQEFEDEGIEVDIKKCANPTIGYSSGKLSFVCETEDAICQTSITDNDIKTHRGNEIQLSATYVINVYATKAGYENSDTVTATLCWIDQQPAMEGISNDISQIPARAVLIQSQGGMLTIQGVEDGANIAVYTVSGQIVGLTKANGNHASFATNIKKGEVAIIKIGEKSVKVVMQ